MVFIKTFIKPPFENNNYLLVDEESKEAVLIDCSDENILDIQEYLTLHQLTLKALLLTHGHFDHVLGVNAIRQKYHIPVYMSFKDKGILNKTNAFLSMMNMPNVSLPVIDETLQDKQTLYIGKTPIHVLSTPGHTLGSVCFLCDSFLFSGDTIFKGSYGRIDLADAPIEEMKKQIMLSIHQILKLDDSIVIYPGHGDKTTIRDEKSLYL